MSIPPAAIASLTDGAAILQYGSIVPSTTFPRVNRTTDQDCPPKFKGTIKEFLEKHGNKEALAIQMRNRVRVCSHCNKPNGYTLLNCNGCGTSLAEIKVSFTDNVFMGFVYGIEKGNFPFQISIRYQDDDYFVIDDPLALCAVHVNCIPTSMYIPDWRWLLKNPKKGIEIIDRQFALEWAAVEKQFLSNDAWVKKFLKATDKQSLAELKDHVISGFNFPPSQFQLHLQFMVPPLIPTAYAQYVAGLHYTKGRFFPYKYVRAVLVAQATGKNQFQLKDESTAEEITTHFKNFHGVDYDTAHKDMYDKVPQSQAKYANWDVKDFQAAIIGNTVVPLTNNTTTPLPDAKAIQAADKVALQQYGRPYTADGKPSGSYYAKAKDFPAGVKDFA
eukprot:TRINITY_DN84752_c0_g1_i1.p1 TRINITY_DN84752_c0_g1~~TRINITY_DN84752_c0_g1_i1.p1  ORF type:complete len:388 (+),score=52.07 TRINITY_DN84752_c0_g1_i1:76-1239(+)